LCKNCNSNSPILFTYYIQKLFHSTLNIFHIQKLAQFFKGEGYKLKTMKNVIYIAVIAALMASCGGGQSEQMKIEAAKQAAVDSVNNVNIVKQRAIDSVNAVHAARAERSARVSSGSSSSSSSTATAEEPKKKGWSSAAKGAVIGAGAGAITGAMVDKKKGEGAIVGGLLGAGAGAATGAIIDNSKKKKQNN
jgi:hypothetical protein